MWRLQRAKGYSSPGEALRPGGTCQRLSVAMALGARRGDQSVEALEPAVRNRGRLQRAPPRRRVHSAASACTGDGEAAPFMVCSKMGRPRGYSVHTCGACMKDTARSCHDTEEKSWTWRCFPGREGSIF